MAEERVLPAMPMVGSARMAKTESDVTVADPEPPPVDFETALERLESAPQDVAQAVFDEVRRQLEVEHGIRDKIERKAQITLSVTGLAITLMMGLGVKLVAEPQSVLASFPDTVYLATSGLFLLAVLLGIASGLFALRGLRVGGDNVEADYRDIFAEGALKGTAEWYRWMAVHIFSVATGQHGSNEKRASLVKGSMALFFGFLVTVALLGSLLGVNVITHRLTMGGDKSQSAQDSSKSEGEKSDESKQTEKKTEKKSSDKPKPTKGGRSFTASDKGPKTTKMK